MKKASLKERSSSFVIGKGLIIIAILIPSSLSFMLGYFVGKITTKESPKTTLQESLRNNDIQPVEAQSKQQLQPKASDASTTELQTTGTPKEATQGSQQAQKLAKIIYTVQVGAFKNAAEADVLQKRLKNKGYKTYMALSESKREKGLYKVWVGKFSTRKEAEELSMKIKKAEGFHAFVTVQKEEESIRQP
ncbi:MAG TPA: SPOR domain-containing protein [Thermodesulfovibrionales bacterium]|nr:SPOR domain-containing protein [Thermodesulfovibrionales bacterium]